MKIKYIKQTTVDNNAIALNNIDTSVKVYV